MKANFIVNCLLRGGSELKIIKVANYLIEKGVDVTIISCKTGSDPNLVQTLSPRINFVECNNVLEIVRDISKLRGSVFLLNNYPSYFSPLIRFLKPTGKIYFLNNSFYDPKELGFKKFFLLKFSTLFHTKIIYGAKKQQSVWSCSLNIPITPSDVLYNGVDTTKFYPSQIRSFDSELLKIVMIGQIRPEKNHKEAIEVVKILKSRGLKIKLTIVGADVKGNLLPELKKLVSSSGLDDNIDFVGESSNVKDILHKNNLFLLCSNSVETFSNAALEAMACGLVPLLSDIGGAAEMVTDGVDGFVYETGNCNELADKIESLLNKQLVQRLSENAREKVVNSFSNQKMLETYYNYVVK